MRSPLAAATLALGIGASTAIYSFVHPLLLHPFTYPEADRLVTVQERNAPRNVTAGASYPAYRDWSSETRVLKELAVFDVGFFFLTGVEEPEQIAGALVTPDLFGMLGVSPALGRVFRADEEDAVILSDDCWRRRFGADPRILGRTIALDWARTPRVERYTVIGVMPPRFWMYYSGFEVFVPLPRSAIREDRKARNLVAIGRLADGVSAQQAQDALSAIPDEKNWTVEVHPWERTATQPLRSELLVLAAGAGLLLLIASANVAGLLLVRAHARRREIAIRAALGAGRWRLAALFLKEALQLGIAAALAGVALAWWGVHVIMAFRPLDLYIMRLSPGLDRVGVDTSAWMFAACAALLACGIAALFPIIQARRVDLTRGLKQLDSPSSQGGRKLLVACEVALSVVLLAGAGLLVKTLVRIRAVDLGYRPDHTLAMRLPVPHTQAAASARTAAYFRDVLQRVSTLPGVLGAALGEHLPTTADTLPSSGRGRVVFEVPGRAEAVRARYNVVSPGYFETLRIPLLRGRYLRPEDRDRVVISESMARLGWPGGDPVGQTMRVSGTNVEVAGVVAGTTAMENWGARILLLNNNAEVYRPMAAEAVPDQFFLAVRTAGDPLLLSQAIRAAVRDAGGVVAEMDSLQRFVEDGTWQSEQAGRLLSAFAALALLLAGAGLYGIVSFAAARRTREIGIRFALGARRSQIAALIARESALPISAGLLAGIAAAAALGRFMNSLLYEVAPIDPGVLLSSGGAAMLAAALASILPLRRAMRTDPAISLRTE